MVCDPRWVPPMVRWCISGFLPSAMRKLCVWEQQQIGLMCVGGDSGGHAASIAAVSKLMAWPLCPGSWDA